MKNVLVMDLEEGMVIAKDSHTSSGIMIIPAGVIVTNPIINHLMSLGVESVFINDDVEPELKTEVHSIKTEKFKHFQKKYTKVKDKLNNSFGKVLGHNTNKEELEKMLEDGWNAFNDNNSSYDMIGMLYSMHNYSDTTYMHCMNVGMIASLIGRWAGWPEEKVRILNACGMFHDIGKLLIPKNVLDKPGRLNDEEYEIMKSHTVLGYKLIKDYGLDQRIVNSTIMHHERCDGFGYPFNLKADQIDEYSKILAIADVYEAMTANRVYRGPVCPFDVIAQFEENGFEIYDTKYLLIFLQNIVDSYLHSVVRLNNGENAEIVLINRQKGSKPLVMTTSGRPVDLMKEPELKISQVIE